MKSKGKVAALGLAILLALAAAAPAQEGGKAFLWDGTHWAQVSADGKAGYIFGIGNLADFEVAASQGRAVCISQAFVKELKTKKVAQIVETVDKYYQENPGKLDRPVIEVVLRQCTTVCPPEAAGKK